MQGAGGSWLAFRTTGGAAKPNHHSLSPAGVSLLAALWLGDAQACTTAIPPSPALRVALPIVLMAHLDEPQLGNS